MTTKMLKLLAEMWRRGMTSAEMARAAGINEWTMWTYIRRHRSLFPNRKHHADWWRERLAEVEGLPSRQAAARLGCSYEAVCYWRRRLDDGTR